MFIYGYFRVNRLRRRSRGHRNAGRQRPESHAVRQGDRSRRRGRQHQDPLRPDQPKPALGTSSAVVSILKRRSVPKVFANILTTLNPLRKCPASQPPTHTHTSLLCPQTTNTSIIYKLYNIFISPLCVCVFVFVCVRPVFKRVSVCKT